MSVPVNERAERALIGVLYCQPHHLSGLDADPSDLHDPRRGLALRAMLRLHADEQPAGDRVLLGGAMGELGASEAMIAQALEELQDCVCVPWEPSSVQVYADEVRDAARVRRDDAARAELADRFKEGRASIEELCRWEDRAAANDGDPWQQARSILTARANGTSKPVSLPWSGVAARLDGGLWPGNWILVGNPGAGKTQWVLHVLRYASAMATPTFYVGLEMSAEGVYARLLALCARDADVVGDDRQPVHYRDLLHGKHPDLFRQLDERFGSSLARINPIFPDARSWTLSSISDAVGRAARATGKAPLVVLDYLQLVAGDADLRERIGSAAYDGKMLARRHGAAVVLVSSTARDKYDLLAGRDAKFKLGEADPTLLVGSGKEAGEIEFSADGVIVLCREPWMKGQSTPVHVAIAKNRDGVTGWARLKFDGTQLSDPDDDVIVLPRSAR